MEKKYQVFVSSTFVDLQAERQKVIDAILSLYQFPVGMEMFSAADEEQWEVIRETIDTSDYYVIIVGMRYGSVIEEGDDAGISYTEKEFNYARSQNIPVLAFVMAENAPLTLNKIEDDPEKKKKLDAFRSKVTKGRTVKFWHTADELAAQVSQSLCKAMARGNRPGWVRTTGFDIEQSHAEILRLTERVHMLEGLNADLKLASNRKPHLWVEVTSGRTGEDAASDNYIKVKDNAVTLWPVPVKMADAENGIDYTNGYGKPVHASREEVRLFRHICQNSFLLNFRVHNDGNIRATGVRVTLLFPNELLIMAASELSEYRMADTYYGRIENAYQNWEARFASPEGSIAPGSFDPAEERFISLDELTQNDDIADLLDPASFDEVVSICPGEVSFDKEEVRHKEYDPIRGVYVLPTAAGQYTIRCRILCNEYPEEVEQELPVTVE